MPSLHPDQLKGTNLYLIGMMGSGKSTTGKLLAERLGYQFFDTDQVIEQAAQQTIPEIFAQQGEAEFRQIETQVLAQLSAYTRLVVATGGGIITQQINWSYLQHGVVIWLDVPLETLQQRLAGDTRRPLLQVADWPAKLEQLLSERSRFYRQADVRVAIAAKDAPVAIAEQILQQLAETIRPEPQAPGPG